MTLYKNETITDQIESILTSITLDANPSEKNVHQLDDTTLQINEQVYRVVDNYREGFDFVAFENRYQEYFEKFDFIVGDWGFEQLRLRGFYQLNKRKVPREQMIDYLDDYLKEYCNFGCRYFVLAKEEAFLKYNQLTKSNVMNTVKKPVKPKVNTKSNKEIKVTLPPNAQVQEKKPNKASKTENFQMKQANKKSSNKVKSEVKKTKPPINQSKKNFVIKQLEK